MAVSKKIIKNSALTKVIVSSLTNLEAATIAGSKALLQATKKSKQSSTEGKRISKKRITLIKRRKAAATRRPRTSPARRRSTLRSAAAFDEQRLPSPKTRPEPRLCKMAAVDAYWC